jgi:hypothetical protein
MQCACAVLYCHLWPVWFYHIFPHYLIHGTIFEKELLDIKFMLWFTPKRLSETFLIPRRIQRDIIVNVLLPSCKVPIILVYVLIRLEFSRHIFEKYRNIKLRENLSIGSRIVPCGQTDMMSLIVAFRNFANAPLKSWLSCSFRSQKKWQNYHIGVPEDNF